MSHRFEGRNVEDALSTAAETLGVERYRLTHRVLVEKRGFLGGVKRVVIDVDVNESAEPPRAAPPQPLPAPTPAPAADDEGLRAPQRSARGGGRGGSSRGRRTEGQRRGGRGRDEGRGSNGGGRDSRQDLRPGDFERASREIPEQGPQSDLAVQVRDWCEEVVDLARLRLTVRTEENDEQITVRLFGADVGSLVDRHGELLDAIQVLANKALVGRKVGKAIELDCEAFKERRIADLEDRAHAVADRVRRSGREELFPPMSPIERRIVHLALHEDPDVTTESRGEGFYKRVAVIKRDAAATDATDHRS